MGLELFLVPILGGYWFLTRYNYTRYGAVRESGYHIFFRSAIVGVVLFGIAHLVVAFGLHHYVPVFATTWKSYVSVPFSDTAVFSLVLGFVLPILGNRLYLLPIVGKRFYDAERAARRAAEKSGDLVELLIAESIEEAKLVEISLRSGKSYIGFALVSGIERSGESDVTLIPMASGYRNNETRELEITTNYAPVIRESIQESSDIVYEDFRIVIPRSEIVSARIFDSTAYKRFAGLVIEATPTA